MANRQICSVLGRQLRNISVQSARNNSSSAPIQLYGLEGRYAHAIYSAATKQKQLEAVDRDFQSILNLFKKEKRLSDILRNPLLTREQKKNAVNELAGSKGASPITINTLNLLAENGRLGRLESVAKSFGQLMSAHRGEVSARVTTAKALDAQQLKELNAVLQTFMKSGHKLTLETRVDSSLIGGMIVELGDRYIDLSISSRLKTFSNIVKETV